MKIRIFRVLVVVIVALPNLAFKNQSEQNEFQLTEGHISFVKTKTTRDLVIEEHESLRDVCERANKNIERDIDYCDPMYFEEKVLEVCKMRDLGRPATKGEISGSYRKYWYNMVGVDKEKIDKTGSEQAKQAAEKIIELKNDGPKHVFDFTISFKCT